MEQSSRRARVVVLTGPSGAGKSRLAARLHAAYGWPIVRLDDFYRDGDDPDLPMVTLGGHDLPDWDDPRSWNAPAAIAALEELLDTGTTRVPTYDIATSRAIGHSQATAAATDLVLAEGIFAAEIVPALVERGRLAGAFCITHGRTPNAVLRFVRDLREGRKPPLVLLRRGIELWRREPRIVSRAASLGASCGSPASVLKEIRTRLIASDETTRPSDRGPEPWEHVRRPG
ncbi:MAG: ATP-binding protein [Actinomycetales bacterium]|uniref:ATP-binding protein n=1 Tax=Candidatus Phosphoribacter hodrii TaxID=2953743 RepID=A0A934X3C8_9MICO|nr:ATP-binding protein [Candidatus Phosphoribacter hodrii]